MPRASVGEREAGWLEEANRNVRAPFCGEASERAVSTVIWNIAGLGCGLTGKVRLRMMGEV